MRYIIKKESVINIFNSNLKILKEDDSIAYLAKPILFIIRKGLELLNSEGVVLTEVKKSLFLKRYKIFARDKEIAQMERRFPFLINNFNLFFDNKQYIIKHKFFSSKHLVFRDKKKVALMDIRDSKGEYSITSFMTGSRYLDINDDENQEVILTALSTIYLYHIERISRRDRFRLARRSRGLFGGIMMGR